MDKYSLAEKIENAFGDRSMPDRTTIAYASMTSEQGDALWFTNRHWNDISWEGWEAHRDAIYVFTPEAFAYYLPSVLTLSISSPSRWFWPADALIQVLDRSPVVAYWDDFILKNLAILRPAEYDAMLDWLLHLSENGDGTNGMALGRAFDTIVLLKEYAAR